MASVTFAYAGKCAQGNHIYIDIKVNGGVIHRFVTTIEELKAEKVSAADADTLARTIISMFCRKWYRDNPSGTLVQMKNALEAEEWVI